MEDMPLEFEEAVGCGGVARAAEKFLRLARPPGQVAAKLEDVAAGCHTQREPENEDQALFPQMPSPLPEGSKESLRGVGEAEKRRPDLVPQ